MTSDFRHRLEAALANEFTIDRELGGGGMSRVFLATEKALQRRVVIKVLPPELAAGVNIDRFRREIMLAAQLQHPHIVPLLATGDEDGILWFSMPFIEGESLRGALTKNKRIPSRDVVRILHDVVDALAYAHARGVVHRDIKPDNILTSGMHALVTDFGVAKALSAAIPLAVGTSTGMAIGTPAYMAPEQLAADPAADHRVDIYAVGLLAYELLTGRSPFSGSSPQATMAAQLTETPKPPHEFADIPEALSAVIMHCLEKDSAKRPQSAQALLAELDALPLMTSGPVAARRPARKQWMVLAGAAAVIAALVLAQQVRTNKSRALSDSMAGKLAAADSLSARDIGPGGDRTPAQVVAPIAPTPRVVPETVVVYRNNADNSSGIQVPVVISRAESLAIVDAFRKRQAAKPTVDSTARVDAGAAKTTAGGAASSAAAAATAAKATTRTTESQVMVSSDGKMITLNKTQLLEELGRIYADSMAIAMSRMDTAFKRAARIYRFEMPVMPTGRGVVPLVGPPTDGRTRVVVANYTNGSGKRELSVVGRDVARFLRTSLPADKYDIVDTEMIERAGRSGGSDALSVGWSLRADFVVDGIIMQRGDSVIVLTKFRDVRDGRFARAQEATAPTADPHRAFDVSLALVNAWLDTARVQRSRGRGAQGGPGGPRPPGDPQRPPGM